MNRPIFFLDANIPMYAAGRDHPYKAACVWLMQEVARDRLNVAIDTEVAQEILHRFSSIGQPELGIRMATRLLDLAPTVYSVNERDIRQAIEIFRNQPPRHIRSRDALHAAVMRNNGVTHIISADQHFDFIEGITRIAIGTLEETRRAIDGWSA